MSATKYISIALGLASDVRFECHGHYGGEQGLFPTECDRCRWIAELVDELENAEARGRDEAYARAAKVL